MADVMDYFSGAGYGQIPQTSQYQSTGYKPQTSSWANANTYAPWSDGNAATTSDFRSVAPQYSGQGGRSSGMSMGMGGALGAGGLVGSGALNGTAAGVGMGSLGPMSLLGPIGLAAGGGMLLANMLGKRQKRSSPDFYAPSYQGEMFTPEEGISQYYNPSPETGAYNQQMSSLQNQAYSQPAQSYDYNYTGGGQGNQYQGNQGYTGGYGNSLNPLNFTFKAGTGYG